MVLLFFPCRGGNVAVVKYLIEEVKVEVEPTDFYGQTPLHVAAK